MQVVIGAFDRSLLDFEEDTLAVGRPAHVALERFILGELARGVVWARFGGVGNVYLYVGEAFEALGHAVGRVRHLGAVGRDSHALHAVGRGYDCLGAGSFAGFFILLFLLVSFALLRLLGAELDLASQGVGDFDARDHVAAFLLAVADYIFPVVLVFVFLLGGPRDAGGEVECLRIGAPGKRVNVFGAASDGERFPTIDRDEIEVGSAFLAFMVVIWIVRLSVAVGEEGDPPAVGRPLGIRVVS